MLAWLIRDRSRGDLREEIEIICREWSSDRAEVKRLQEAYLPQEAELRKQAEKAEREQRNRDREARLASTLQAFHVMRDLLEAGRRERQRLTSGE